VLASAITVLEWAAAAALAAHGAKRRSHRHLEPQSNPWDKAREASGGCPQNRRSNRAPGSKCVKAVVADLNLDEILQDVAPFKHRVNGRLETCPGF
jgi:hypothetical protein